ncbi:unnamed protein product [Mytilus coruscus]|uniref:C2H2-type domain-containing protein n=1 Tax=Mytilus coruscus TaxID=42192 RepID=A0A6J8DTR3_MYTCO|nr:unnamed protein product [Mytilus coruscus]
MKIVHVDHLKRVEGDGIDNQLLNVDSSFKTLFESESQESNDTEIEAIVTFLVTDSDAIGVTTIKTHLNTIRVVDLFDPNFHFHLKSSCTCMNGCIMADADVLDYDEEGMDQEISVMNQGGDMNESDKVEFFFKLRGLMQCPVEECGTNKFASRTKYLRHWEEKHMEICVTYTCCMNGCQATCKRRHDIKTHLSRIHGVHDKLTLEASVAKINKVNRMDQPATPSTSASTIICTSSTPTVSRTSACVLSPVTSAPVLSTVSASLTVSTLPSCPASAPTHSASLVASSLVNTADDSDGPQFTVSIPARKPATTITLEEYRQRPHSASSDTSLLSSRSLDTSLGYSSVAFQSSSTQTTCRDLPPFVVPPILKGEEELEEYVAILCNAIDCIGRTRKVAKDRLESIRKEGTRLKRERQERRTVEAENRRLRTQLAELKNRDNIFQDMEQ